MPEGEPEEDERVPWRFRDHVGVLSGILLGGAALFFLLIIATNSTRGQGALEILVVLVIGITLIAVGNQMRGGRGH